MKELENETKVIEKTTEELWTKDSREVIGALENWIGNWGHFHEAKWSIRMQRLIDFLDGFAKRDRLEMDPAAVQDLMDDGLCLEDAIAGPGRDR